MVTRVFLLLWHVTGRGGRETWKCFLACGAAGIFLLCLLGAVMSEQMEADDYFTFFNREIINWKVEKCVCIFSIKTCL